MTSRFAVVCALALCACPSPNNTDGGAGGGTTGAAGGGTGGSSMGGGSGGGSADAGLTPDAYCIAFAQNQCAWYERCAFPYYPTTPQCVAVLQRSCDSNEASRVRGGGLRFDPAVAQRCVDQFASAPCATNWPLNEACIGVVTPVAPIGHVCQVGDCDPATGFCPSSAASSSEVACPVCRPYLADGQSCVSTGQFFAQCGRASYCRDELDGGRTCAPKLADGAVCDGCDGICASSGYTDYAALDGGPSRCGARPLGGACGSPRDCGDTAYCAGVRRDPFSTLVLVAGTCTARYAPGAACTNDELDDGCPDAGSCLDGHCTRTFGTGAGTHCDRLRQCSNTTECDWAGDYFADGGLNPADGTCVAHLTAGQPCEVSGTCAAGLWCSPDGGCAPNLAPGTWCVGIGNGCPSRNPCFVQGDGGEICQPTPASRSECHPVQQCPSGELCTSSADSGTRYRCTPLSMLGEACPGGGLCTTRRCAPIVDGGARQCVASCFP